ncbi:MAG: hypothetical protein PHH41_10095, partial [Sulfurimonas sp.]|nr:hypothetical protein [Sulfurimonas sp.]
HFHQNHRHNLVPLCREHHNQIHDGKIKVEGFVMTSKGLELQFEEQMQKSKNLKEEALQINVIEEKEESEQVKSGKILLDDW